MPARFDTLTQMKLRAWCGHTFLAPLLQVVCVCVYVCMCACVCECDRSDVCLSVDREIGMVR